MLIQIMGRPMSKKIGIIILTIILSLTFISCSTTDYDNIDIDNGHSSLLANTKWHNNESDHTIFFGAPDIGATSRDGSFSDDKYWGKYLIYTGKYSEEFSKKFEDCSDNIKEQFWNNIDNTLTSTSFGLVINLNDNENTRFEYIGCIYNDKLILCDYKNVYVYTKTTNNYDIIMDGLSVDEETADNIIKRINTMLTLDYYNIISINKNPELGYIFEVEVLSTDKYYIYTSNEYDIMLITKDNLEENGGKVVFRQKE